MLPSLGQVVFKPKLKLSYTYPMRPKVRKLSRTPQILYFKARALPRPIATTDPEHPCSTKLLTTQHEMSIFEPKLPRIGVLVVVRDRVQESPRDSKTS